MLSASIFEDDETNSDDLPVVLIVLSLIVSSLLSLVTIPFELSLVVVIFTFVNSTIVFIFVA